jgi:hypothetical protein
MVFALCACSGTHDLYVPGVGATVVGTVSLIGTAPHLAARAITKDQAVCGSGGRPSQALLLREDGTVANVVIRLVGVQSGENRPEKAGAQGTLDLSVCEFAPHVQVLPVGVTLELRNLDPLLHSPHGTMNGSTVFNRALPTQGMRQPITLRMPGIIQVRCDAGHTWEGAWIVVHENAYAAVTGTDGAYIIQEVPPGVYTLVAWHEILGTIERQVTVPADARLRVDFTFGS